MNDINMDNVSTRNLIIEMHRRVLEKSSNLGIDLPPIEDELSRMLDVDGLSACHPTNSLYYPDWLKKNLHNFITATDPFFNKSPESVSHDTETV